MKKQLGVVPLFRTIIWVSPSHSPPVRCGKESGGSVSPRGCSSQGRPFHPQRQGPMGLVPGYRVARTRALNVPMNWRPIPGRSLVLALSTFRLSLPERARGSYRTRTTQSLFMVKGSIREARPQKKNTVQRQVPAPPVAGNRLWSSCRCGLGSCRSRRLPAAKIFFLAGLASRCSRQ